jgi:hypothetical protein
VWAEQEKEKEKGKAMRPSSGGGSDWAGGEESVLCRTGSDTNCGDGTIGLFDVLDIAMHGEIGTENTHNSQHRKNANDNDDNNNISQGSHQK